MKFFIAMLACVSVLYAADNETITVTADTSKVITCDTLTVVTYDTVKIVQKIKVDTVKVQSVDTLKAIVEEAPADEVSTEKSADKPEQKSKKKKK